MACAGCNILTRHRAVFAVLLSLALAIILGVAWYTRGQPDPIQPDQNFELQFGRGSGWHGLDVLRVTSDGRAVYEYQVNYGEWQRKRFAIGEKELADFRDAINAMNVWSMPKAYHANVLDGTQWVLLVRVDGKSKSVYFDNNFPHAITQFADFVDRAILEPFADPVKPEVVPVRHHRKFEKDLWESIR